MSNYITDNVSIEDAEILFRNFAGKQSAYNPAGSRNFCVIIPDDALADKMAADGWNVKRLRPREEGDPERPYIQVNVSFNGRPPMVKLISSSGQTILDEDSIDMLDFVDIDTVDLIVSPYNWRVNGKSGVKGYLRSMYVVVQEDEFAKKYAPSSANGPADDDLPF